LGHNDPFLSFCKAKCEIPQLGGKVGTFLFGFWPQP
jgi:hypothetical protein